ncbi:hypothetical protein CECT5772_07509 [Streptococcus equi subsp. ruminatorum CECT 5772]|uniref:Uncharacterized protein n=1 Tax=Streptococcus equi subsp. ruminatorum CECT 5772 TaxID=1051981 RepID=A0A922NTH0_9STRE|nr:hypothetical protein CECT5772_07509 [Streptococcus equi subsp. ruminatorum CECT 5772]
MASKEQQQLAASIAYLTSKLPKSWCTNSLLASFIVNHTVALDLTLYQ